MDKLIKLIIKDGLGFPSGFVSPASYTCVIYCRVPDSWFIDNQLLKSKEEIILEKMYGKNWCMGNSDGSFYVISSLEIKIPEQVRTKNKIWLKDGREDRKNYHYWYYHISESDIINSVPVSEF